MIVVSHVNNINNILTWGKGINRNDPTFIFNFNSLSINFHFQFNIPRQINIHILLNSVLYHLKWLSYNGKTNISNNNKKVTMTS